MNPLIAPPLPFDMKPRAREAVRDLKLQQFVGNATHLKDRSEEHTSESSHRT